VSRMRTTRARSIVLAVLAVGALALSGCAAGYEGVTNKQACANGAPFLCTDPVPIDAP
jgi:hypothetical protein